MDKYPPLFETAEGPRGIEPRDGSLVFEWRWDAAEGEEGGWSVSGVYLCVSGISSPRFSSSGRLFFSPLSPGDRRRRSVTVDDAAGFRKRCAGDAASLRFSRAPKGAVYLYAVGVP